MLAVFGFILGAPYQFALPICRTAAAHSALPYPSCASDETAMDNQGGVKHAGSSAREILTDVVDHAERNSLADGMGCERSTTCADNRRSPTAQTSHSLRSIERPKGDSEVSISTRSATQADRAVSVALIGDSGPANTSNASEKMVLESFRKLTDEITLRRHSLSPTQLDEVETLLESTLRDVKDFRHTSDGGTPRSLHR